MCIGRRDGLTNSSKKEKLCIDRYLKRDCLGNFFSFEYIQVRHLKVFCPCYIFKKISTDAVVSPPILLGKYMPRSYSQATQQHSHVESSLIVCMLSYWYLYPTLCFERQQHSQDFERELPRYLLLDRRIALQVGHLKTII